ncbi:MAG: hypothetical protein COB02_08390 [Candidatus Cloacimonadota bacterium]|nr:MAG: hypothetical protein COB02_08390 [Candidatus Cloacimonadota bacterium]
MSIKLVLDFWFQELSPKQWFLKSDSLDLEIENRFFKIHNRATQGELFSWRDDAEGCLAEIIVLDQFSRNIYRNKKESFLYDPLALILAQQMIKLGLDKEIPIRKRSFIYMPFMHSESTLIHKEALTLFSQEGLESSYQFEMRHKKIIDRFGRYPHRNEVLQRKSTKQEQLFLSQPGSSF